MNDKLTQTERAQLLALLEREDPIAASNQRRRMESAFADDPTKPPLGDLLTAADILNTDWPEPTWAIPGILPVGLTILAGRPKVGKSWLALQIALSVASGGMTLGEHVQQGPVLYLALEDRERRLKDRMTKQGWTSDLVADFIRMGQFEEKVGDLRNGGGERLARQIEHRGYRFVVIDTLSRSVYGDQNDVAQMTAALTPLQEMAHDKNCAVVLNDHHNKMIGIDNRDAINNILGSTAKGAMADTIWGLYRERGKSGAKLIITGRDVEERTLALTFDGMLGCWQCDGEADQVKLTENRQAVVDAIEAMGKAGLMDIAAAVDRNKGSVYRDLQDLAAGGLIKRVGNEYTMQ